MPFRISHTQAIASIRTTHMDTSCVLCDLIQKHLQPYQRIFEDDACLVILTHYPRQWGHLLVLPKVHCTCIAEVSSAQWLRLSGLAHVAARVVREVLQPPRMYVTSLGSARSDLPMTTPHVHIHVLPVYNPNARPSQIFSWRDGIFAAPRGEWEALHQKIRASWRVMYRESP